MTTENLNQDSLAGITANDWDAVRLSFQNSLMGDASLNSLAEDLGMGGWPVAGKDETPAKYTYFSWGKLQEHPNFVTHPERIPLLVDILRQTLSFDDPFGDMVQQDLAPEQDENVLLKTMTKLGIPPTFPIVLTNLSDDTKEFCTREELKDLESLARFAQGMAQQIVIGGDFRTLVNALANCDEGGIATFVPFRPGSKGLHLPEATGLLFDALTPAEQQALIRKAGGRIPDGAAANARSLSRSEILQVEESIQKGLEKRLELFADERKAIAEAFSSGDGVERMLMVLNDPAKERVVAAILRQALDSEIADSTDTVEAGQSAGLSGFFSRLFRRR